MTPEEMLSLVSVIFRLPEKVAAGKVSSVPNIPSSEVLRWLVYAGPIAASMKWSITKTIERCKYLSQFGYDPGVELHRRIASGEEQ